MNQQKEVKKEKVIEHSKWRELFIFGEKTKDNVSKFGIREIFAAKVLTYL